jgi:uncharacterized protein YprB with RNaseH-like and TPR domain
MIVPCSVSLALLLAACGSSGKTVSPATNNTTAPSSQTTGHVAKQASNVPSVSAKMVCNQEAQTDIYEQATGVKTVAAFTPTWVDHVYACDYVYPAGAKMRLSVKETSNDAETTAYFDSLATKLGRTKTEIGIVNAFQVRDGSVVVRKDFKVLLVDVTKLPAKFGVPADARGDVAINVAQTIMGCWTGA